MRKTLNLNRFFPPYPRYEGLDPLYEDNGTMADCLDDVRDAVIGHKIIKAEHASAEESSRKGGGGWYGHRESLILTLDSGREVILYDTDDCCAYTQLEDFWLSPASVNHTILGVGTTDGYETWHIFADFGDIMKLEVGWSCGNPFYYGYGFDVKVREIDS